MSAAVPPLDPLDLTGPLPSGTTVLEASAGTGKTYTIAALLTRAVAEGRCELPEVLVVTFTRAATAELRDRIRRRLVEAQDHLALATAAVRDGGPVPRTGDVVLDHLAAPDPDAAGDDVASELQRRLDRLVTALRDFDTATISTIHGFTQQVLRSVGLSVEVPRDLTLLEDTTELVDQITSDVVVRRFSRRPDGSTAPVSADALRKLATDVVERPDARVLPSPDDPDPVAAELGALALELRAEASARKAARSVLGHDDLLVALRTTLADPEHGERAVGVLRERYRWALVDEFQDTDPIQWDILARAFGASRDPDRALVLIGDPKQAIYAFRGADVATYLRATGRADDRRTLQTNFRSDPALLDALDPVLRGARFGHDDIVFRPVQAPVDRPARSLVDPHDDAALAIRVVDETPDGTSAPAVRGHLARDVAATVVHHLRHVRHLAGDAPLAPERIAVLVRTNTEASQVQRALRDVDVPAVVNGVGSVLESNAAEAWSWLLDALERPSDSGRARRVASSPWCGWDAADLAAGDTSRLDELHERLHRWATVLRDHGVATLERTVTRDTGVAARMLAQVGGERLLTDLRHVGQLLHAAELHDERGITGLRSWLIERRADASERTLPPEEEARRLESDDAAVQILTVHRSKGLEFDVCLVPYLWSGGTKPSVPVLLDDPDGGGRLVDVGPTTRDGFDANRSAARTEAIGEALRLAYVALTRARHRAVVWWAKVGGSDTSALARLLFRGDGGPVSLDDKVEVPGTAAEAVAHVQARLREVAASVATVPIELRPDPWEGRPPPIGEALRARHLDRTLDRAWSRTSYSAILRRATGDDHHRTAVTTEVEIEPLDDEPDGVTVAGVDGAPDRDALRAPVPLGEVVGGTAFGTLVHAVLEHVDFQADPLDSEVARVLDEQVRHLGTEVPAETVVPGLVAAIRSPLGPLAGEVTDADGRIRWRRLADLPRAERLDELTFELPLAGGDAGRRDGPAATVRAVADLLDRPPEDGGLADDDPFLAVGYPDALRAEGFALDLRGYLTGAIDLTFRVPDAIGGHRYLVADHKTNRVAWPEAPTLWDHRPDALVHAMVDHHYPLQALLYQVALHRYLRWRLPAYDPDRHLGGALYLFLRGMVGPDTPEVDGAPVGVVAWRPPAALVVAASDILAHGRGRR